MIDDPVIDLPSSLKNNANPNRENLELRKDNSVEKYICSEILVIYTGPKSKAF